MRTVQHKLFVGALVCICLVLGVTAFCGSIHLTRALLASQTLEEVMHLNLSSQAGIWITTLLSGLATMIVIVGTGILLLKVLKQIGFVAWYKRYFEEERHPPTEDK